MRTSLNSIPRASRVVNKPVSQSLVERYFELNDLYKSTQLNDLTNQLISN